MKKQALNPYLPPYEYIPDGEPHVFDGRVYVYGSHDRFNGYVYCLNDYVCWSVPVDDLGNWRYEGVIYRKTDDPYNQNGEMCLYAPDVSVGTDGRYYLYYVLDKMPVVSVAVCETPAGSYKFYGYVHYSDGTLLGKREGDEAQFDPAVLTENGKTYLYTGFGGFNDLTRTGAMATVLCADMLTVAEPPVFVLPSQSHAQGTEFEKHPFFEAASIRKVGAKYYFVYSSVVLHELCYAVSDNPVTGFKYGGVIISNNDIGISAYKPYKKPMYYGGNNHGGIIQLAGKWYIFYHRHTNGTSFSRQGCIERIEIKSDGSIPQVEMTSCGANGKPLNGFGQYPAYIACNLFCNDEEMYSAPFDAWMNNTFPKITQDGADGDKEDGYIRNMRDGATAGFKYFEIKSVKKVSIMARGYAKGEFIVKTAWDGAPLCSIPIEYTNVWKVYSADITIPDGINAIYFTYLGSGSASLHSFTLE